MAKEYGDQPYNLHGFIQDGEGHEGSQQSWMYKAIKDGKPYGVKFQRVFQCPNPPDAYYGDDEDMLRKLERRQKNYEKQKKKFDAYCEYRDTLYSRIKLAGQNGPEDYWHDDLTEACDGKDTYKQADPWLPRIASCKRGEAEMVTMDLPYEQLIEIMLSYARNIKSLHDQQVVHSDIKPDNIIIVKEDGKYVAYPIDFDMSFMLDRIPACDGPKAIRQYIMGGTEDYAAPETVGFSAAAMSDEEFDITQMSYPIDIFATGITFYEYLMGHGSAIPIKDTTDDYGRNLTRALFDGKYPDLEPLFNSISEPKYASFFFALIGWLIATNPNERPTASQLVEVLESVNERLIPSKFRKDDPNEPWEEDNIRYVESKLSAMNIEISKGRKPGLYLVKMNGVSRGKNKDMLIAEGLAVGRDDVIAWESDRITLIPQRGVIIFLGSNEGEYIVNHGGGSEIYNRDRLIAEGLASDDGASDQPWEEDNIELIPREGVKIARGDAIGSYLLNGHKISRLNLVNMGYAKTKDPTKSLPWDKDSIAFIGRFGVSLSRGDREGEYLVVSSGRAYRYNADQMVSYGYARRVLVAKYEPWESDYIEFIPSVGVKISQAEEEGLYKLEVRGVVQKVNANSLVSKGYARLLEIATPWEGDNIDFVPHPKIRVIRAKRAPMYTFKRGGMAVNRDANGLIRDGLAVVKGGHIPIISEGTHSSGSISSEEVEPWASDNIVFIPKEGVSIKRGRREGVYAVVKNKVTRFYNAEQLIAQELAKRK